MSAEERVGIIGSGNSARALACYLSEQGWKVSMLVRNEVRVAQIPASICSEGKICGIFCLESVTCDEQEFMASVDTVFVATVTTAYIDVVRRILPFLTERHSIILFSGKLGGCLEVEFFLQCHGMEQVTVMETDAIFACRIVDDCTVRIRGFKRWNLFSSGRLSRTLACGAVLRRFFPFLEPADNFLQRGLSDFGAMTHPLIMLINMNAIDRKESFRFYHEGFTRKSFRLLEALEEERMRLAAAYETMVISLRELLYRYYQNIESTLYDTLLSVPNYRNSMSPDSLDSRYIYEDVANTLVPSSYLAKAAGLQTHVMDSLIHMSSALLGIDFMSCGRTLERLGLGGMSYQQIVRHMHS